MTKEKEYDASSITVLEGLQAVRERPGMYIGDTQSTVCISSSMRSSTTASMRRWPGYCTEITSPSIKTILSLSKIMAAGSRSAGTKGIAQAGKGCLGLEVVMTILHAGGKFDKSTYKVSGGLHGVGVSCVNALSKKLHRRSLPKWKIHEMEFSKGKPTHPLKVIGETTKHGNKSHFLAR